MLNRGTILAIAVFVLGNGTSAGLQITGIVNPVLGWTIIAVSTISSGLLFLYAFKIRAQTLIRDDGTTLLTLLNESYERLKLITEKTIKKLRRKEWHNLEVALPDLQGFMEMDVKTRIQNIYFKGIIEFVTGKKLTIYKDADELVKEMLKSPLFSINPEILAKDSSIILRDKLPYLRKAIKYDRKYNRLLRQIALERDKFPDVQVSTEVDFYFDHSIKLNAIWILTEYDVDNLLKFEEFSGSRFPIHFISMLKDIPNQMDLEMGHYRNNVSIAVSRYHNDYFKKYRFYYFIKGEIMSYIRAKEIPPGSGNWYDYEVKSVWNNGSPRQKIIRYIGKSSLHASVSGASGMVSEPLTESSMPSISEPRIPKMKTSSIQIASAMGMYYGGMPLDAIQQQFKQDYDLDMSESNYWNWVKRFTKEAVKQAKDFKPNVGSVWVADETYMKLGKRKVYFWDIIDADTRYILATHVSFSRSGRDAKQLMSLARKRAGKAPSSVVTDKLKSYIVGIEDEFGGDSKHRQGGPFNVENNTNLIERFHRTLEQRTEVFQKYKNITDIRLLTNGWLINYNFFKQHEGVGNIPPAQAMSKVVPFKDWNDIVRDDNLPDIDYKVSLSQRRARTHGKPVKDIALTPITVSGNSA